MKFTANQRAWLTSHGHEIREIDGTEYAVSQFTQTIPGTNARTWGEELTPADEIQTREQLRAFLGY